VLTCATRTGAEILGRADELGTLGAGKLADVLVVDGYVLADVSAPEDRARLLAVLQGGAVKAGRLASVN
jgi:imidazolonepropionase-like amidohydrolase